MRVFFFFSLFFSTSSFKNKISNFIGYFTKILKKIPKNDIENFIENDTQAIQIKKNWSMEKNYFLYYFFVLYMFFTSFYYFNQSNFQKEINYITFILSILCTENQNQNIRLLQNTTYSDLQKQIDSNQLALNNIVITNTIFFTVEGLLFLLNAILAIVLIIKLKSSSYTEVKQTMNGIELENIKHGNELKNLKKGMAALLKLNQLHQKEIKKHEGFIKSLIQKKELKLEDIFKEQPENNYENQVLQTENEFSQFIKEDQKQKKSKLKQEKIKKKQNSSEEEESEEDGQKKKKDKN